jgi:hypothetical protein
MEKENKSEAPRTLERIMKVVTSYIIRACLLRQQHLVTELKKKPCQPLQLHNVAIF